MLLRFLDDFREGLGFVLGQVGEDLPVQLHVCLLQAVHELGVGRVIQAGGGIDLDLPQTAGLALLQAAVDVGVAAGFADRNLGQLDARLALPAVALGSGEEVLAVLDVGGPSFDAHRLGVGGELADGAEVRLVGQLVAALVARRVARLARVEVGLPGGAAEDLVGARAAEPFGRRFVRLNLRHRFRIYPFWRGSSSVQWVLPISSSESER